VVDEAAEFTTSTGVVLRAHPADEGSGEAGAEAGSRAGFLSLTFPGGERLQVRRYAYSYQAGRPGGGGGGAELHHLRVFLSMPVADYCGRCESLAPPTHTNEVADSRGSVTGLCGHYSASRQDALTTAAGLAIDAWTPDSRDPSAVGAQMDIFAHRCDSIWVRVARPQHTLTK
jgi:hypothetical protein